MLPPSAITGMGIVCSIGGSVEEFTRALEDGRSGIALRAAPAGDVKIGAELRGFSFEDAVKREAGGSAERESRALRLGRRAPLSVRAAIVAALEAWSSAGLHGGSDRVAIVVAGSNLAQGQVFQAYARYGREPAFTNPRFALEFMDTFLVGILSELLGSSGEGFTVGGASASGNVALIKAHQLLALGLCDVCVVVGAMADLSDVELQAFYNSGAMPKRRADDPAAACRPFDRDHEGFVYGQASGCVIVEAPEHAARRGAAVLAELLGGAVLLDGCASASPSADGERRAMARALAQAGLGVEAVDYLNAHGSSSPLGDRTEIEAIKALFAEHLPRVIINATKGLIGHCLWSAGVVEAIATVVQLAGGFVHPNINLDNPIDQECRFAGRSRESRALMHALSNSFGFGGINACLVLKGTANADPRPMLKGARC